MEQKNQPLDKESLKALRRPPAWSIAAAGMLAGAWIALGAMALGMGKSPQSNGFVAMEIRRSGVEARTVSMPQGELVAVKSPTGLSLCTHVEPAGPKPEPKRQVTPAAPKVDQPLVAEDPKDKDWEGGGEPPLVPDVPSLPAHPTVTLASMTSERLANLSIDEQTQIACAIEKALQGTQDSAEWSIQMRDVNEFNRAWSYHLATLRAVRAARKIKSSATEATGPVVIDDASAP